MKETMKRIIITVAIVLGLGIGAFAQEGGLFGKGPSRSETNYELRGTSNDPMIGLPSSHGDDKDAAAPLGSGIAVLVGLGAAYALGKKRKE